MFRVVGFGLRVYVGCGAQGLWPKVYDLRNGDVGFGVLSCCHHIKPRHEIRCETPLGDHLGMQRSNQQMRTVGFQDVPRFCAVRL